jgi:hypothetical protein
VFALAPAGHGAVLQGRLAPVFGSGVDGVALGIAAAAALLLAPPLTYPLLDKTSVSATMLAPNHELVRRLGR